MTLLLLIIASLSLCSVNEALSTLEKQECIITEDGNQVCEEIKKSPASSPPDYDGHSVGFGWREEKPSDELKNDPNWMEAARRNNVIVDPAERKKLEAMFEMEEKDMDLGGSRGQGFKRGDTLYEGYLDRTEERKALDRYEDGGSTVYSSEECYDVSESCSLFLKRSPEACGDVTEEAANFDEEKMRLKCSASCRVCIPNESNHPSRVRHTSIGERQRNDGSPEQRNAVNKVRDAMIFYLRDVVLVRPEFKRIYRECYNHHELCAFWASVGECQSNPRFMQQKCNLACRSCDKHPDFISSDSN